ncbi:uncharacterized protein G2W53_022794 [Senna tora]|uniref:Uncharacterized protein n=1 Tax=Senna tora TaxID=362788 RepID=A0A834TQB5_9FABA|nr:uncharacterized protein G2W53_022794 [Senna tora]
MCLRPHLVPGERGFPQKFKQCKTLFQSSISSMVYPGGMGPKFVEFVRKDNFALMLSSSYASSLSLSLLLLCGGETEQQQQQRHEPKMKLEEDDQEAEADPEQQQQQQCRSTAESPVVH